MTTVADYIKDTLGLLQVIDPKQPVKDADMQTAIRGLNRVCRRIEANGVALGWQDVDNPSDTLPMQPESELGVMYTLALTLAPQWGVEPMAAVVQGAQTFMADLRRDQAVATPLRPILDVPEPSSRFGNDMFGTAWRAG